MPRKVLDEKPQFFRMEINESGANTFTEKSYNTPVLQQAGNGKAIVMEMLRILIIYLEPDAIANTMCTVSIHISDRSYAATQGYHIPGIMASSREGCYSYNASTGVSNFNPKPIVFELTDGAGNGVLYGKQVIYGAIQGSGNAVAKWCQCAIIYRLVEVDAADLIGIIRD